MPKKNKGNINNKIFKESNIIPAETYKNAAYIGCLTCEYIPVVIKLLFSIHYEFLISSCMNPKNNS